MHERQRKRAAPVVDCGVRGIHANAKRRTLHASWRDPADPLAGLKRFSKKVDTWEAYYINLAARELQEEKENYIVACDTARAIVRSDEVEHGEVAHGADGNEAVCESDDDAVAEGGARRRCPWARR